MKALLVPEKGAIEEVEVNGAASDLALLRGWVGGHIEAVPVPGFIPQSDQATAYVNEEGKFALDCGPNMRATDFMVPGVGIFAGDYVAGPFVLCGFDPRTGDHAELPKPVADRMRLIETEAGA